MIDLHTHTTASDGTFSPAALVRLAAEKGLTALSVTDHDTIDGIAAARYQAQKSGVAFVSGIEISAQFTSDGTMHILGYCLDEKDRGFQESLQFLKDARKERNPKIIERMNDAGISITLGDVLAESGGGEVGRPHFARALVKKGHAASIADAFERYLSKGAPCYVDKTRLSPADSIALILRAGGVPVLAHPGSLNLSWEELEELVRKLVGWGMMGIECFYSTHTPEDTGRYLATVEAFGLVATGGTDFHGKNRPKTKLGTGLGDLSIPHEVFDRLVSRHGPDARKVVG
ncbi:MAG: PHP domain-containing protein [Deltaproteobacteria bacterium]|nr:PHP domain-containing protein [Candidatus Zymogenaceae bacterium]